ncbi:hypothetical protein F0562_023887 [Nyssa sinensis]|uniref:Uncharacterized protein n=1 Tax=Nyssa sinensis TaxID=561372 RepID=A0A5J5BHW9_9ASTE|nr:hypothetical protein F0562_023887 [Nyssa sinensis]
MLGSGLQLGPARGEDMSYIPVKARKNQNQNQQPQQQQQQQQVQSAESEGKESYISSRNTKIVASDDRNPEEPSNSIPMSPSEPFVTSYISNLKRFLESTTPTVAAQYLTQTTMRGWSTCDVEFQPYFALGDLWESFTEWSAYGAGVPLKLDGNNFVQYYVPYLSGIQLYGESMRTTAELRQASKDSDSDYDNSDRSSDYETEEGIKHSGERWGHHLLFSEANFELGRLSLSDNLSTTQESSCSDESESGNHQGHLLFEFLEQDPPYSREPLTKKILDLSCQFPQLKTLRSCDLMPISWISVAWYPIYRIPAGRTLRDLDACFLTYHSLSTLVGGGEGAQVPVVVNPSDTDGVPMISLPVFGMASYKFRGSVWIQNGVCELEWANSLMQVVDNRLRLLQVNHPDFQFFASHGTYCW